MYDRRSSSQVANTPRYYICIFLLNKKNMNGISDTGINCWNVINVCSTCSPREQLCKVRQYVEGSEPT